MRYNPFKNFKATIWCFPEGTKIPTPHGPRDIESLGAGDSVTSWSIQRQSTAYTTVLKVRKHDPSQIWEVQLDDGEIFRSTAKHSILTCRGWQTIDSISTADSVLTAEGVKSVTEVKSTSSFEFVYSLVTDREFTTVTGSIVSHNFSRMRKSRELYWRFRVWLKFAFENTEKKPRPAV